MFSHNNNGLMREKSDFYHKYQFCIAFKLSSILFLSIENEFA